MWHITCCWLVEDANLTGIEGNAITYPIYAYAPVRHDMDHHTHNTNSAHNEQILLPGGRIDPAGDVFGWYIITKQYYERYRRPIMHTETNCLGSGERDAPRWLWKEFLNVRLLHSEGVPVIGFTWYSLTDQMDWDVALGDERNMVNPVGLFDLDRRPRPVAATYKLIIRDFADQLSGKRGDNHRISDAEAWSSSEAQG